MWHLLHNAALFLSMSRLAILPHASVSRISPAGMREVAWHIVPEPVLTVRLDGSVEYETCDGEVRHVSAGSFVLVEDTFGKGHLSRHSPEAQTVIWISLPDGLEPPTSQ